MEHDAIAKAASLLGKLGGKSRSKAKRIAARKNGALGGRKRVYSRCPLYGSHRFGPHAGETALRCPCGKVKPS
jgi:hypothetical protein